ncbi:putative MFS transporter, AGZA family, xanthine/uracil permease [Bryocella elongata]|uniref:Putative MFS transporter, AGZA family, xanthine/uracil permease n=1 Tax=Bryocella elongata TaxID=863522 RepID=A0A1H5VWE8_9BACT|nr:permease [Bryocella elongata]SEF90907.1 putative MFS transporter, AGZA family, xanthine/uracil permease [Bryocella elongata]
MARSELRSGTQLPWFTAGDLDGFFGLFFSGFPDLLLIVGLAPLCGLPMSLVTGRILPGVAISVLAGNLFYAWQARRLAEREGRDDVTAIPFGVNTPTIFAYVFLIMAPIYARTHDATLAWHAGIFASLISGIVQTLGAFGTDRLRRSTPRAALLAPLAGLALAYLCLGFVLGVFQQAAIALTPMLVLFALYGSRMKLPFRIPPAMVAIGLGASLVAVLRALHLYDAAAPPVTTPGLYLPHAVNVFALLLQRRWWSYLAVILPLAALDTLGSLMILESIKLEGDDYATMPSLAMNGLGTLAAALLGSPFPTTIYLGHAAHKANGARSGYSALNGIVTLVLCTTGVLPWVLHFVPLEVTAPVIVWFGLITVGQAFSTVPRQQTVAVAMGLIPALAQWATTLADTIARKAGSSLFALAPKFDVPGSDLALGGLIALGQGSLLTSMLWAAALALIVSRRFVAAAGWLAIAALLAGFGVIHAYTLTPEGVESHIAWNAAPTFAFSYAAGAVVLLACAWWSRHSIQPSDASPLAE